MIVVKALSKYSMSITNYGRVIIFIPLFKFGPYNTSAPYVVVITNLLAHLKSKQWVTLGC